MSEFIATLLALVVQLATPAPPDAGVADYQLGGAHPPAANVQIVVRDRTDPPADGRYSICYVNAFQTQPGSIAWWQGRHPELLLRDSRTNRLVHDPGWPDEVLLDIRTPRSGQRWPGSSARGSTRALPTGIKAVEPDNLDSWTRSRGLLRQKHAVAFAMLLIREAHQTHLAIAQKNTPELSSERLGFDFAVAEECEVYRECDAYTQVYGRKVIEIEYTDNGRAAYERACAARSGDLSIMLRDRDVVPRGAAGHVHRTC